MHGSIGLSCSVVDGETHRGKLMSPEIRYSTMHEWLFINYVTQLGGRGGCCIFDKHLGAV